MTPDEQRALAMQLYNTTWDLIDKPERTRDEDDELLHRAHASRYHWGEVGTAANRARGEWICSRVYTVLGRAEPALHHARRCLELVESHPADMEEWDLPAAYEALARGHSLAGESTRRGGTSTSAARRRAGSRTPTIARRSRPILGRSARSSPRNRWGPVRVECLDQRYATNAVGLKAL